MEIAKFTESAVEETALEWLDAKGWRTLHGPRIVTNLFSAEGSHPDSQDATLQGQRSYALQGLTSQFAMAGI
jgi:hypothetical protein